MKWSRLKVQLFAGHYTRSVMTYRAYGAYRALSSAIFFEESAVSVSFCCTGTGGKLGVPQGEWFRKFG